MTPNFGELICMLDNSEPIAIELAPESAFIITAQLQALINIIGQDRSILFADLKEFALSLQAELIDRNPQLAPMLEQGWRPLPIGTEFHLAQTD